MTWNYSLYPTLILPTTGSKGRKTCLQMAQSAERPANVGKLGRTCNWFQVQENTQLQNSKCKTCNQCQAQEIVQMAPSAGKHAIGAKCEKTCIQSRCLSRENTCKPWLLEKHRVVFKMHLWSFWQRSSDFVHSFLWKWDKENKSLFTQFKVDLKSICLPILLLKLLMVFFSLF